MFDGFESKVQKSKICLVTGATGVVGLPLVRKLLADNHKVKILARNKVPAGMFPPKVEIIKGDLNDRNALAKASDGVEWIFHLAAKLHINNPGADLQREYQETNVAGTENLVRAATRHKVEKFVFFSTINVYGAGDGNRIFDEKDEIAPFGFYAESKAAAEKIILAEKCGVVLRLAAVYGSRMKGNYLRLLGALRRNRFLFIGNGRNRRTLIHHDDAARAAMIAAEQAAAGTIYNVTDGPVHAFSEIIESMSKALGKRVPKTHLPLWPVKLGIGLADNVGKLLKINSPVNRALLEKLLEDVAVSGDKLRDELSFYPQYDLKSGWVETVRGQPSTVSR